MTGSAALVIAPAWVGDAVMAQCLYARLKAHGFGRIEMVAPRATATLADRMPEIDRVHELDVGHGRFGWRARRAIGHRLRGRYDAAFVLPNSWKSALVPWFARVPRRTGFVGEFRHGLLNDARRLDPVALPRMIDRFVALAEPADRQPGPDATGIACTIAPPRLSVDAERIEALCDAFGLDRARPVTALCPGAEFGPAKRWPAEAFATLARLRVESGDDVWLFGSPGDAATCAAIVEAAGVPADRLRDLSGRTRLLDAVDLLSRARVVVSNDSGLMHVAGAVGVPVVAIYGSTSPAFTPPLAARQRIVSRALACAPCFRRECPLGHLDCLNGLPPAVVAEAIDDLVGAPASVATGPGT